MFDSLRNPFALLARLAPGVMFVLAAWSKITGFEGTVGYIAARGLPMPAVVAVLTIMLEFGAGLALIAGLFTRWAALALAVFTLLAALMFHNYWAMPANQQMVQQLFFMKNLSIAGGLLALAALGAGAWSVDSRLGAA